MVSPHAVAYTVEVVDKTGKAIHTSRTLFSAIKEAREAFKAKKAAKKAERVRRASEEEERIQRAMRRQQRHQERELRQITEDRRGSTGSTAIELRDRKQHSSRRGGSGDETSSSSGKRDKSVKRMHSDKRSSKGLVRRATADDAALMTHSNISCLTISTVGSSRSEPSSPTLGPVAMLETKDDHLTALFTQCNDIFDSLSAFQYSVTTLIGALQRDPETLAVVGLTLAEISSVITKLSPGVLATMKASWPMVFAFLSSPQFAIMAGVGIGTTIVLIGGYKIVKKLMGYEDAPKPDPTPVDLGGRVVGEVEVREITAPPPAPRPVAVIEEIPDMELTPRHRSKSRDDGLAFGKKSGSSGGSGKSRKDDGLVFGFGRSSSSSSKSTSMSDMAFGHDERASQARKKSLSPRSRSPERSPRSAPTPAHAPMPVPAQAKTVPDLQFDIPKKHHKSSKSGKSEKSSSSRSDAHSRSDKSERSRKSEKERHR